MANRYWVGGAGNWNTTNTTNWSTSSGGAGGASVPTVADAVFFDANSGTGSVVANNSSNTAASINFTGFTGTFTRTLSVTVAGSITCSAGMTLTPSVDAFIITGTGTITSAGQNMGTVYINAPGATISLGDAFTASTYTLTLTAGTFTTTASNYAVTVGSFELSGTTTRTLTLNGSTVTLDSSSIPWQASVTTGLTFNAGTSTIVITSNLGQFIGGGLTYNNVSFTSGSTSITPNTITGINTFSGTLTLSSPSSAGVRGYGFSNNQTINTLVAAGASAVRRVFLHSYPTLGVPMTLTVTTWATISDIDFRDITMNSSRSGTRLGDCGGNTNITFPSAKGVYWNLAGTQDWSATGWATTSLGTPAVNNFPLAQDTAFFTDDGATDTVTTGSNLWNVGSVNMNLRTTAATIGLSGLSIYGDRLQYGSGVTPGGGATFIYMIGRGNTQGIWSAGKTLIDRLIFQNIGGTVELNDALTTSANPAAITLSNGGFKTNNFNVTTTASNSSFSISGTSSKTTTFGSSLITIAGTGGLSATATGTTIYANTATMKLTSSSAKSFSGGGINYNGLTVDQGGAGALTFSGANTFGNITNTYSATGATTITFTASTTNTFTNWNASGTSGKLLTINSTSAGSQATVSKSSGTVSADYLSIRDSSATGGATWYAGANSTNVSNNSGWIFSAVPGASGSGNFLMFFN